MVAACCASVHVFVQDMPIGLHGVFPVLFGDVIHMAGGGTEAAYSQSTLHYRFTPPADAVIATDGTSIRAVADDSSSALARAPSAAWAPAPSSVLSHLPAWLVAQRPAWLASVFVTMVVLHVW